nr:MFS transporter [Candidatus Sigynarchaeota archaeon]
MNEDEKKEPSIPPSGGKQIIRKGWPVVANHFLGTFTWNALWLSINVLVISQILWPGDDFHAQDIAFVSGISGVFVATSSLVWGVLVDRLSRVKLMSIQTTLDGAMFALYGFMPEGLREISFAFFLIATICTNVIAGGGGPNCNSYADDAIEEHERSQFFGILNAIQQLCYVLGLLLVSLIYANYWRFYFWIVGGCLVMAGLSIGFKAKEPKRGAMKRELRSVLKIDSVEYKYGLNKETMRSTIIAPTNLLVFVEGIFTQMIFAVPGFLIFPFLQSAPYHLSAFNFALSMVLFGMPGAMIGNLFLSKKADALGKRNVKNRVYMIVGSLYVSFGSWIGIMLIPFPIMTIEQGNNLGFIMSQGQYWLLVSLLFLSNMVSCLYQLNQRPLIQKINLPEAQGAMTSANGFLEMIGNGVGIIISGAIVNLFNNNYRTTVVILMLFGVCGTILWLLSLKWLEKDLERISKILSIRAEELKKEHSDGHGKVD